MKKVMTVLVCMLFVLAAAAKKEPEVSEVRAVGDGVANGGRPMITVTLAAKKADKITDLDFKNAAVRCVLFRGWVDAQKTTGFDTSTNHPPICGEPDAEVQYSEYFNDFFNSGEAANYVDIVPETKRVMKNGKLFEVSQTVVVNQRALRKKMESNNIVKKLRRDW